MTTAAAPALDVIGEEVQERRRLARSGGAEDEGVSGKLVVREIERPPVVGFPEPRRHAAVRGGAQVRCRPAAGASAGEAEKHRSDHRRAEARNGQCRGRDEEEDEGREDQQRRPASVVRARAHRASASRAGRLGARAGARSGALAGCGDEGQATLWTWTRSEIPRRAAAAWTSRRIAGFSTR